MSSQNPKYVEEVAIFSEEGKLLSKQVKPIDEQTLNFLKQIAPDNIGEWSGILIGRQYAQFSGINDRLLTTLVEAAAAGKDTVLVMPRCHGRRTMERAVEKARGITIGHDADMEKRIQRILSTTLSVGPMPDPCNEYFEGAEFENRHTLKVEANRKVGGKHAQPFWRNGRW